MAGGRFVRSRRLRLLAASLSILVLTVAAKPGGGGGGGGGGLAGTPTPIQIFGAWHCSDDACTWGTVRTVTEFDSKNHWLIDRGDGTHRPSVNLVILSFVQPLKLLQGTTDATTLNGVPRGMTQDILNYFKAAGIRVMLSIGGITYVDAWNKAFASNATVLGQKAAAIATQLGVGIEVDYEESSSPDIVGLQAFIDAYRAVHPYDASGNDAAARLTIDVAAGDRWLIGLDQKATADWLRPGAPVLDYANAMVPSRQPSASSAESNWLEHVVGKAQYSPPIPALAPAKFTGSLFVAEGSSVRPECDNYGSSVTKASADWVQRILPTAGTGTTPGLLGFMFWAAERPSTRGVTTQPPNTCEGGMGVGATTLNMPLPMPPLRQG
jgi:hypothetical protein